MYIAPLIASTSTLHILLEELLREHLLQLHALRDSRAVLVRVLRRGLLIVDARSLRLLVAPCTKEATVLLLPWLTTRAGTAVRRRRLSVVRARRAGCVAAEILVLELVCQAIRHVVALLRRPVAPGRRGTLLLPILVVGSGVVVEVALGIDAAGALLRAPNLLLAGGVGEGLGEGRGGGGEGSTLLGGEVGLLVSAAAAEVEVQAVGVAVVLLLLLLLLVRHGGQQPAVEGVVSEGKRVEVGRGRSHLRCSLSESAKRGR